jgi:Peptidase A4 family
MMSKLICESRTWPLAAILALFTLSLAAAAPLAVASSPTGFSLTPTTDSQTCFQNVNGAIAQQAALSPDTAAQLLQVAESSSQYQAFAQAGETISLVSPSPAMQYSTTSECAGVIIDAYTFSFVSGAKELSVAVDPSRMTVLGTLIVPAFKWGVALNSSAYPWGGGYGYWNGSTYSSPTYPWYYIEGEWTLPTVTSSCSGGCTYGIWSGLTDSYHGDHIAQTGFGADAYSGGSTTYWLWYEFLPASPTNCMVTIHSGDTILSASYSNAWVTSGGSASSYNEDTYDSTAAVGCATSSSYNWSSGLGSNSYFAILTGETMQSTIPNFGKVTITGTIYDNHYNGGPSGHCTSTPYSNGDAESFYYSNGGHIMTESLDNGHCAFNDDYW